MQQAFGLGQGETSVFQSVILARVALSRPCLTLRSRRFSRELRVRPRGSAFAARCGGAPYERLKPAERLGSVFLLAAVLLGLDDDHPLPGDALVVQF